MATLWSLLTGAPSDAVALRSPEPLTYGALRLRAEALAGALLARGVGSGDRVGVSLPLGVDEVAAIFAVARLGAVLVPLHARLPVARVRALVEDCRAKAVICAVERVEALPGALTPDATAAAALPPEPEDGAALAAILYTSGSTGPPRGVLHRHDALLRCARGVATYLELGPDDRLLGLLPLSFHYGMSQVTSAFSVGASVSLAASGLPGDVLATLAEVTVAAGIPSAWTQLLPALESAGAPPRLRLLTIAGGAASPALLDRLEVLLPRTRVVLLYGFTEALRATWLPPALYAGKRGAMGIPVPDARLDVVDEDGRSCGPGEVGELVQWGPLLGEGYWEAPEATAARWRTIAGERACLSGDLVRRDADGVYWFVGRKDGVIKTAGFRVGPGELEALVGGSQLVAEVVAVGVPDAERGQAILLFVEEGDPGAILRWCRRELPGWMVPKRVVVGPLPRLTNGKVDRAALARRAID